MISIRSAISSLVAGGILFAAVAFGWFLDRGSEVALKRVLGQVLDREQADVLRRTSDFFGEPLRLLQWTAAGLEGPDSHRQPSAEPFRALLGLPRIAAAGWFDASTGETTAVTPTAVEHSKHENAVDAATLRQLTSDAPDNVRWSLPYDEGDGHGSFHSSRFAWGHRTGGSG